MRKITRVLAIALVAIAVAAPVFAQAASEASAPSKASLRFAWWGNDKRHQATIAAIDHYMEITPNVEIEAEYRGKSEREKVATELAGGTVADIVQLNPPWMGDFTTSGDFFVDLGQYKSVLDTSGFAQQFMKDYGVYNGKLIALPTGLNARTIIINKTLAEKMGLPTDINTKYTWEDLYTFGKEVNKKDSSKYCINADTVDMTEFVLLPYLVQKTGNQLIKDDYTRGFTPEELKEALEYIARLYRDKVVQGVQEGNVFLHSIWTNPKWINGDMVLEFSWTSLYGAVTGENKDEMTVFSLPVMDGAKNTGLIIVPSQLLAISNKSENPEAAAKFLNYFFNDLEAGKLLKDVRSIPPVDKVQKACQEAGLINPNIIKATEYAQANQGLYRNSLSSNAEIVKILNDTIEKVAYDYKAVDSATAEAVKLIDYVLKELKP